MKLEQALFMAEAEGLDNYVTTREAKIQSVIKELKAIRHTLHINSIRWCLESSLKRRGLSIAMIGEKDFNRIVEAVNSD